MLTSAVEDLRDDMSSPIYLHGVFMALWKTTWRTTKDVKMPDPTLCFLALHTMKEDGSFSHPKDVTGVIAKLHRSIQLAMLHEMHLMVDQAEVENQLEGMDELAMFVHEKQPTTFNSLMSLQHYASSVAYSTMSMPQIWWLDRESWTEMLFEGQHIKQEHVRKVFKSLEEQVIDLWENKILFGSKMHVKLGSHISDNLLRTEPGYSFLDDGNNPFNLHMKELGKHALEHHLTTKIPGTNTTVLDVMACKQWLLDLAELEGLLMVSVEMKGGAPARGTELTSMLVRNTAQRVRNAMALGKTLCIVRQYDKTTNLAQGDKLIPHAIDSVDADILIQLHTFARPLAQVSSLSRTWRGLHALRICTSSLHTRCFQASQIQSTNMGRCCS